jgi:hypothetical protein
MNRTQLTPDGTRPASIPSYIDAREHADRRSHLRVRLLLLLAVLHVVYVAAPLLPFAQVRAVVPLLLWLPPLCTVLCLWYGLCTLRHWSHRRQQRTHFVPIPPVEELS